MNKKTLSVGGANKLKIGGEGAMLEIAEWSLPVSGVIMSYTVMGCYYLSKKESK